MVATTKVYYGLETILFIQKFVAGLPLRYWIAEVRKNIFFATGSGVDSISSRAIGALLCKIRAGSQVLDHYET